MASHSSATAGVRALHGSEARRVRLPDCARELAQGDCAAVREATRPVLPRGALIALLAGAPVLVGCQRSSSAPPPAPAALEQRLFFFADGAALAPSLAGMALELTFGTMEDAGGPFVGIAPAIVGLDRLPARVEGVFSLPMLEFRVESGSFDPLQHPDLAPGTRVTLQLCRMDPDDRLTLQNAADGALSVSAASRERPNVVLVLTDDQRWDTLDAMPLVLDRLAARGVTFTNAFVTTPVCGPSRACFLAGGFPAQDTGVLTNGPPNGGLERFDETRTLGSVLQRAGYRTGFVGKYVNGYAAVAPRIPPGWTRFVADRSTADWTRFSVAEGESRAEPTQGELSGPITGYLTDYQASRAVEFVEEHAALPFFLLFAPDAPHSPATAAPGDEGLFPGYVYRERAYGEADRSDKPAWVADAPPYDEAFNDEFHRDQLRSLQALDRAVAAVVDAVEREGKLASTVFLFTSDNGFLWGEHGLAGKGVAYEESIRVPLVVARGDAPPRTLEQLVAADLDVPATIYDLAAVEGETDGVSLVPLLEGAAVPWREELLIESPALGSNEPLLWSGLRVRRGDGDWKYVEYGSGERELYDLALDPFEEENAVATRPALAAELAALLAPEKGLAITTDAAPAAFVGVPYELELETWGARGTLGWSVAAGELPDGLWLDPLAGVVEGVPEQVEERDVAIAVEDVSAGSERPRRFVVELHFSVGP